ncbi:MAG TPA: response regulator [Pyrinomonadaceae bacterium]|jgi:two-component system LytT family response regulator
MSKIRTLIIDDEPFSRERVRRLLTGDAEIEILGEAGDGIEAVRLIKDKSPALVFLDVQMPGRDGFEVLAELAPEETPVVIFLTAYDRYAVKAFETAALDYLLKPFDEERFEKAVARAKSILLKPSASAAGQPGESEILPPDGEYLGRVLVKKSGRVYFFNADEIEWVEAYGNYVRLHFETATYLLRETISGLETRLDPQKFVRVHRSGLVNVARIREIETLFGGRARLTLQSGAELETSRRFNRKLLETVGKNN